ncbi:hypothetical protein TVAG_040370 [Trichomonas vaginalis G3]|uniref:DUF3447 domain-containing protein n=1 Tax=Trichomonas vaginalis (strain ATCC PRA-98 / G3) TaxID=412133 RepID=A2F1T2_TRIV3|nr:temperature-gated cation channel protein [Trichomonas vaginalis G3]EAY01132.1 hypothetical protein TVAG_040370 [Trichomonas vaginalis G3]KAI5540529.1 temperature-gated cation channel protein [Trichomonas vaginalis G3]|eukprot:XP_001313984.1 hypothetical protein [Trichomonas vaginalis G3]
MGTEYDQKLYNQLMEKYKEYDEVLEKLYNIKPEIVEDLFIKIKNVLKKYKMYPIFFINVIATFLQYNSYAAESYWTIVDMLMKEYKIKIGQQALEYPGRLKILLMQNYPKKLLFLKKMQFKVKDIFIPNTDKTIEDHFKNDDVSYFKDKPIQFLINYFNLCIKLGAVSCYKYFKSQGLQPCSDNLEQAIVGRNKEILIDVIENLPQKCFMFTKYEQIRDLELIQLLEKHNQTFDASSTADYYNLPGYLYLLSKKMLI